MYHLKAAYCLMLPIVNIYVHPELLSTHPHTNSSHCRQRAGFRRILSIPPVLIVLSLQYFPHTFIVAIIWIKLIRRSGQALFRIFS